MPGLRFIVPFGRHGASDRAARAFARAAGISVDVVEDVPGEGGLKGVEAANARAARGEPTLLLGTPTTHILLPERLGATAAPAAAFAPVALLGAAPNVLLVGAAVEARNVQALVALAKRRPLAYASAGYGQTIHACTALFCAQAGISMDHAPYPGGSALAYDDVRAGRVQVYFDNLLGCADQVAAGVVVPLAVSSVQRSAALPGVPTMAECGFEHRLDVWMGVFGAHLDADIRARLASAVHAAPLAGELARLGLHGGPRTADAMAHEVVATAPRWREALAACEAP